ncbi:MAG: efflux transporter outer membrane subunit, partial [Nitrospirae bacterium]|nr:efflux transporter outer membrane subunit [Nitrospirota bacterium]
ANTAWWEQFNDPVLNDLIQTALRENKDVKIAAAKVEQFAGQYGTTRAALFPQVSADGTYGRQRASELTGTSQLEGTGISPTFNSSQLVLNAAWEIDLWGKLRRATEAARADLLGTEDARRAVILTLVASVASTYIDLRDLDKQLEISKQTAKSRGESYDLFKLRFEGGVISELELNQVKSEYEQALSTIPQFEKRIAQTENSLSTLLGRNPGPIARGKTIDQLTLPAVPAGLPSDILMSRPDILQAEQNLIAANANIGVAKSLYFPSISLTGMFGWASNDLSDLFKGPAKTWSWAVPASMPIFTAGSIAGQVKSAEAFQQQALIGYRQSVQTAFREVDDALIDQKKSREQIAAQDRQVEALRNYARIARLRYDNGYTSYIEVLDAERSLFNAELSYTQTQGTLFLSLVNLYKSIGGGWVVTAEGMTKEIAQGAAAETQALQQK